MATYEELSPEQKKIVQDYLLVLRPMAGELARTGNHAANVNDQYLATATAVLAEMDAADVIPNMSGLAGAVALTQQEVIDMTGYFQTLLTINTSDHRQRFVKACGAANMVG